MGKIFLYLYFLLTLIESAVIEVNALFFIVDLMCSKERKQKNIFLSKPLYIYIYIAVLNIILKIFHVNLAEFLIFGFKSISFFSV